MHMRENIKKPAIVLDIWKKVYISAAWLNSHFNFYLWFREGPERSHGPNQREIRIKDGINNNIYDFNNQRA